MTHLLGIGTDSMFGSGSLNAFQSASKSRRNCASQGFSSEEERATMPVGVYRITNPTIAVIIENDKHGRGRPPKWLAEAQRMAKPRRKRSTNGLN
jgi:hypothetical protein